MRLTKTEAKDHRCRPTAKSRLIAEPVAIAASAVARKPEFVSAQFVVVDDFLRMAKVDELIRYTLAHEPDFVRGKVISRSGVPVIDTKYRRARELRKIGQHKYAIVRHLKAVLPLVLKRLRHRAFHVSSVDVQITASNHGDFVSPHRDSDRRIRELASREITFVYYFRTKPKAFRGGELRVYDSQLENGEYVSAGKYKSVAPRHNRVVFFPSSLWHEVRPVHCPSRVFADSRFTVHGWILRNIADPLRNR
jgi:Rps23 Pro-64 3,4-dihydroxylase Tpa1-like proline 4-hydroxylase